MVAPGQEGMLLQRSPAPSSAPLLADEAQAVAATDMHSQCSTCLRSSAAAAAGDGALLTCTGCRVARYCGRACQKADWKSAHKRECASLKKVGCERRFAESRRRQFVCVRVCCVCCVCVCVEKRGREERVCDLAQRKALHFSLSLLSLPPSPSLSPVVRPPASLHSAAVLHSPAAAAFS